MKNMYKGLPEYCYATLDTTEETIIIKKGESGYYPCKYKESVDELNETIGVTKAQKEAMKTGSLFGWDVAGSNPLIYDENGKYIKDAL
jgi:hypothetical protein